MNVPQLILQNRQKVLLIQKQESENIIAFLL